MSFKTYLKSWGESLFTSKKNFISEQAMPSGTIVSEISVTSTEQNQTVVAPCDGYVGLSATSGTASTIDILSSGLQQSISVNGMSGWLTQMLPVKKGSNVSYRLYGSNGTLRFVKTIGGGLARLFKAEVHYAFA